MKEKIISIVIIIISVLTPILILPNEYCNNNYNILKLIALLIGGIILLVLMLANYKKVYIEKLDILVLIFAFLVSISTIFSSNIKISIIGEINRYEGMLMFFTYILIFFSAKKFFKEKYLKKFVNIIYVVIFIICILSISQYYIKTIDLKPIFAKYNYGGSSGTFGNSNFLGSFVSLFLPILISTYIITGKKQYLLLSILLFTTMLVSVARSSYVAFIISLFMIIIFVIYKRKKEYFKRFLLILITCVCAFLVISYTGKENTIPKQKIMITEAKQAVTTGVTNKMGSSRIEIWKITLKIIKEYPILGVGPDNMKYALHHDIKLVYSGLYEFILRTHTTIDKAHNEYLHIAATIGIPALIIYLTFIGAICLKNLKLSTKDNARFILLMSVISYLAQAFFNISTIGIAPLFWLMLGLISNDEVVKEINKNINNEEEICT